MVLILHHLTELILQVSNYAQRSTDGKVQKNETKSNDSNIYLNSEFLTLRFYTTLNFILLHKSNHKLRIRLY